MATTIDQRATEGSFSLALEQMVDGEYVRRSEWSAGTFIFIEDEDIVQSSRSGRTEIATISHEDILAKDWQLV